MHSGQVSMKDSTTNLHSVTAPVSVNESVEFDLQLFKLEDQGHDHVDFDQIERNLIQD